jgi:nucleolar protein 9
MPEASDHITTLLRDPTSSHLLETLVSHCLDTVFGMLWSIYIEHTLKKLGMHPVANFVTPSHLIELITSTYRTLLGS